MASIVCRFEVSAHCSPSLAWNNTEFRSSRAQIVPKGWRVRDAGAGGVTIEDFMNKKGPR
jgi:hypothetical protein